MLTCQTYIMICYDFINSDCIVIICIIICLRVVCLFFFFFQAEDGIRDVERSRGLGDVYRDRTTGVSPIMSSSLWAS